MRAPINRADMDRFLSKKLSPAELAEFESRLREAGLAPDVRRAAGADLFEALRPTPDAELFDDETLLAYVKGEADAATAAIIAQLRRLDRGLDQTLETMERAKRQVEASLQSEAVPAPAAPRRRWAPIFGVGLAAAALLIVAILLLPRKSSLGHRPYALSTLLSSAEFGVDTQVAGIGADALRGAPVGEDAATTSALADLAAPTKDAAKMTPARCLLLPDQTTTLAWQGIRAPEVTCSLFDARGVRLAQAKVIKSSWVYRKPLPPGEYRWSAEWRAKNGQAKIATRRFRVADPSAVLDLRADLTRFADPVSRAVTLARRGYTYDSLRLLDRLVRVAPTRPGLRALRDSVARRASS